MLILLSLKAFPPGEGDAGTFLPFFRSLLREARRQQCTVSFGWLGQSSSLSLFSSSSALPDFRGNSSNYQQITGSQSKGDKDEQHYMACCSGCYLPSHP